MSSRTDVCGPVQVSFVMPRGQWEAVCVLAARARVSPSAWVEGAVAGCVATGLESLPDRCRFAGAGVAGDVDAQGGGYALGV